MTYKVATVRTFEIEDAADTWTITHNMGAYPVVDVYILNGGEQERVMPSSVTYLDENTCQIGFSAPRTGVAVIS